MAKFNTGDSVVINEKGAFPLCLEGEKDNISCSYILGQTGMVKGMADTTVPVPGPSSRRTDAATAAHRVHGADRPCRSG